MTKHEFLTALRKGLQGLPQADIEERLTFYGEIIDDKIEEGILEEDAVSDIGNIDELISGIIADTPFTKLVKEKITPKKKLNPWEKVLLVLGSPIWLSLAVAVIAVIFAIYVSIWSVIISLWAIFASLLCCAFAGIVTGIILAVVNNALTGIFMLGAGILCAGFSVFVFFGCKAVTKGILILTKKTAVWLKNCFIGKERAL